MQLQQNFVIPTIHVHITILCVSCGLKRFFVPFGSQLHTAAAFEGLVCFAGAEGTA